MPVLPMFPLGTVLQPTGAVPLQVFEPRYRRMMRDCLAGQDGFGVVLIERGSEVGGGDVRASVGTRAAIVDPVELADRRWTLLGVGIERLRVVRWLADDPYPRAEVEPWPDPAPSAALPSLVASAAASLRRLLAAFSEAGGRGIPVELEVPDDPILASYRLCALSPLGPADQYRLLSAPSTQARVELLIGLLDEAREVLLAGMRLDGDVGPA
ncbi:LON peptidase substrate-binding domain-containing protein [Rhabdothermincola sediminis]|uniref:LON peptidase substrate-binding domain-containing protein n=1 Tax=Rhabdothermincola sediminis TaxID=2751370 RepID=UPI001AA0560E|nr:LON peptidase substrate-binding domain-containing protein [Rhabdothermincola sediminis]